MIMWISYLLKSKLLGDTTGVHVVCAVDTRPIICNECKADYFPYSSCEHFEIHSTAMLAIIIGMCGYVLSQLSYSYSFSLMKGFMHLV